MKSIFKTVISWYHKTRGAFKMEYCNIQYLGGWVLTTMDEMEQTDFDNLVKSIAAVFLHLADGISAIVAE